MRKILIDNDALLKLAQYDLLDLLLEVYQIHTDNIYALATAKYALLPVNKRLSRCKDEASAKRLEDFLHATTSLSTLDINPEFLDTLNARPEIDSGEAVLFAAGASNPKALIITGDKKAIAALYSNPELSHIAIALSNRVVPLVVAFVYFVQHHFEHTQICVRAKADVDKALINIFGVSAPAGEGAVFEGLASYINYLKKATGDLLYSPFN